MAYHKPTYLFLFLPILLLIYQIAPRKFRRGVLLGAGYLFFWSISGKLVLYLIGTTIFTHYIGNFRKPERKSVWCWLAESCCFWESWDI